MDHGRLIVCERSGQWAAALRRELADAGLRVWETRSLADAWEALAATPAAFLVLELLGANAEPLLGRMAWLGRDFPRSRAAVVASRRLAAYESLAREAGAVHFACSLRHLAPLARMIVRHLAELPPPQQTLLERIWASLPWGGD
ncbi:MAG: hypothetical protein ABSG86_09955 [Thermoguttaceae bacterium]|jgi:hypothetical protein